MTGGSANETDDADVAELVVRGGVAQSLSSTETRLEDADASEVVREALRLLERADRRDAEDLLRLREAWEEGVGSGDAGPLDFAALKAEARGRPPGPAKG